jgi:hypothetical protein
MPPRYHQRMRAALLASALLASGCGGALDQSCDGVDGTCLELVFPAHGFDETLDQIDVQLTGVEEFEGRSPSTPAPFKLPVTLAIRLGNGSGEIAILARGIRDGTARAFGVGSTTVSPGGHVSVIIALTPVTIVDGGTTDRPVHDFAPPADLAHDFGLFTRLMFLLPATDGALGPSGVVDQQCTAAASAAGIAGPFAAILGYDDILAPNGRIDLSNTGTILRPDGLVVAADGTQFWTQNHFNAVGLLADKTPATATCVWTNFTPLGDLDEPDNGGDCGRFSSRNMANTARTGDPTLADSHWAVSALLTCDQLCHVYCISQ